MRLVRYVKNNIYIYIYIYIYSIGDWQNFDRDVCEIVRLSSKGHIEARIDIITVIITNFAAERFGYKEP